LIEGLAPPSGSAIEGDEGDGSLLAGFRPEKALITIEIDGEKHHEGDAWLRAQVAWVEPTGADTFIHLRCDDHSLVVRSSPNHRLENGQEVSVLIPQAAIRWFRSKDGLSVA
ncbi:MAG: TOBE domain-containing protein, partial [Verrucomicrobiota bacterium]|nr:TOBE domain-containing protein [Verrucomicrobiota bacterium]